MSLETKDIWRNYVPLIYESKITRRVQSNMWTYLIHMSKSIKEPTLCMLKMYWPINHDGRMTWSTGITQSPSWTNLCTWLVHLWMLSTVLVVWSSLTNDSKELSLTEIRLTWYNAQSTMKKNNLRVWQNMSFQ